MNKKKFITITLFILLSACHLYSENIPKLARDSKELKSGWKFAIDPQNSFLFGKPSVIRPDYNDDSWSFVDLPHTWNINKETENYFGLSWYRFKFKVPENWQDGFIYLEFLGSYLITDVWVNGKYIGRHNGGYTGFKFDISDLVDKKNPNTLVVRCDSAKREDQAPGAAFIWFPYSGLYREVYISRYPRVFPESTYIGSTCKEQKAIVNITTNWKTGTDNIGKTFNVKYKISSDNNPEVFEEKKTITPDSSDFVSRCSFNLENPRLWSPDEPNLYTLELEYECNGVIYKATEEFGIRTIETSGRKILLNSKEIKLKGVAMFEDSKIDGPYFDLLKRQKDLEFAKSMGANMIRLGHYPHHPRMLSLCDKMGLIVYEEIPVWQFTIPDKKLDEYIKMWAKPQLQEMIKRDYNRPSLCFIGVANEIRDNIDYLKIMLPYAKELAPDRLITYASDSYGEDRDAFDYVDIISKNLHLGWFHGDSPYEIKKVIAELASIKRDKPIFISEVGAMSIPALSAPFNSNIKFSEEYHSKVISVSLNHIISNFNLLAGICIWTLYDFKGQGVIGSSGLYDYKMKPRVFSSQIYSFFNSKPSLLVIDSENPHKKKETIDLKIKIYPYDINPELLSQVTYVASNVDSIEKNGVIDIKKFDWKDNLGSFDFSIPERYEAKCIDWIEFKLFNYENKELASNLYYFHCDDTNIPLILKVHVLTDDGTSLKDARVDIDGKLTEKTDYFGWCTFFYFEKSYKLTVSKEGFISKTTSGSIKDEANYQEITISIENKK